MRAVKPIRLCMLSRTLELGRQPYLVVSVLAMTPFSGERTVVGEVPMWKLVEERLGAALLDECYSKPAGEVIVHGSFHAPGGIPAAVSFVGLEMTQGEKKLIDKKLAVLGDRVWKSGVPSEPSPMVTMPIDWEHAFGGEEYEINPTGRGIKPKDDALWRLPNIEDRGQLIRSPSDKPRPAGFGPMGLGSPIRRELAGSYGGDYLTTRFPGPAADMDPRFFHTTYDDQRIAGFFTGDETFAVTNMHATKPRLEGKLTPLRAKAFLERRRSQSKDVVFEEVGLRMDTAILFPEDEMIISVFRGMVPVSEDDASDVLALVIGGEDASMPREMSHYRHVLAARTDRGRRGPLMSLKDEDLMPQREAGWGNPRMPEDDMMQMTKLDGIMDRRFSQAGDRAREEARASLVLMGFDPDEVLPRSSAAVDLKPPALDDFDGVAEYVDAMVAVAEAEKSKSEALQKEAELRARAEFAGAGMDWDAEVEKATKLAAGPPRFRAKTEVDNLLAQCELARIAGMPWTELEAQMAQPGFVNALVERERLEMDAYRAAVTFKPAAAKLDRASSQALRDSLEQAKSTGAEAADLDFTGADLSGLDLSGMNLDGALMECANLAGTRLDGASLVRAVLTRATLTGASFTRANLTECCLGDTTLDGVDFTGATLKKALMMRARIDDASFAAADLGEAIVLESTFGKVDLSDASLAVVALLKHDLRGVKFVRTRFKKTQIIECDLSGCDLTEAELEGATVVDSKIDGARFTRASMVQCALARGITGVSADFTDAKIERSCMRDAVLHRANFTRATLKTCEMGNVDLTDAVLTECDARGTMFIRANFTRVNARGGSFMEGILKNSILEGADFSKANLFRAMLSRVRGDDKTRFTGANLDNVLKEPVYKAPTHD